MRILGITRRHIPGRASQIGILRVVLQRSESLALPESQQPVESDLLDGAIICVRGTSEEIASVIIRAVIDGESLFWAGSPLDTCRARSGMQHRRVDVGTSR